MVSFLATMSDFCNPINKDLELSLYNSHKIPVHTYEIISPVCSIEMREFENLTIS
jgi:hypothetical protein